MNKIAEIRMLIPRGGIKEVANRSNSSIWAVSRVINKGVNDPEIIKHLTSYLREVHQIRKDFEAVINDIKSKNE